MDGAPMKTLTPPKVITFDFFGTVIDWRAGFRACGVLAEDFDRTIDAQGRMQQERFRSYAEIVADSLREVFGMNAEDAQNVGRAVGYFPLYPDSRSALYRMMRVVPCAALTNSDLAHKAQILEGLGYLSGWASAEDLGAYKPSPAFFERAKEKLGIAALDKSWWHVSAYGDYDLETATALGLTSVFVRRPHSRPGPHDISVADLGVLADLVETAFPPVRTFEYKLLDSRDAPIGGAFKEKTRDALEKYLATLGREGWEIVSLQLEEHADRLSFVGVAKRERVEGRALS
jgi:2-haloalkanoic acid dehalogenase type II